MTVAYWVVAGVLALFYLLAGGIKVVWSKDQVRPRMELSTSCRWASYAPWVARKCSAPD